MIQRVQSIFLGLAAVACLLMFFFPLAYYYHELQGNYQFFIYGIRTMDPEPRVIYSTFFTLPLILLAIASIIFSLATVFLYKNRPLQIRLCAFNMLTLLVLIMVIFFFYANKIKEMTGIDPDYQYAGMVMPLIAILMVLLANRAIRKDEALVKSADRLR